MDIGDSPESATSSTHYSGRVFFMDHHPDLAGVGGSPGVEQLHD